MRIACRGEEGPENRELGWSFQSSREGGVKEGGEENRR